MNPPNQPSISTKPIPGFFILLNVLIVLVYFSWWLTIRNDGNPILFGLLFFGEIYHVTMVLLFWFTMRGLARPLPPLPAAGGRALSVAAFITVAGEPIDVIRQTVTAVLATHYQPLTVCLLNDSYVAGKSNWQEYEELATELGITCRTRRIGGGAKAGNINNGLAHTTSDLVAIFDADMQPHQDFFQKTVPYFADPKLGFVQTPQYYANHAENGIATAAWEQQEFFFGPIMRGKQGSNAAFICGTNVVLSRRALESVGGINETSIAEDFLTSLYIHRTGWHSLYIPEVLAEGMAPTDLFSYHKQQLRWARGSVEVLFNHNPLLLRGLSWSQRLEYLSSALFYCNGIIVVINALIPLYFLATGVSPITASTTLFALYFLPFMVSILASLQFVSGRSLTFRAISFTHSSWFLQIQAVVSALLGVKMAFAVTPKTTQAGRYLSVVRPQLFYILAAVFCAAIGITREGMSPAVITNLSWVSFNVLLSLPFIFAALPEFQHHALVQIFSHAETA